MQFNWAQSPADFVTVDDTAIGTGQQAPLLDASCYISDRPHTRSSSLLFFLSSLRLVLRHDILSFFPVNLLRSPLLLTEVEERMGLGVCDMLQVATWYLEKSEKKGMSPEHVAQCHQREEGESTHVTHSLTHSLTRSQSQLCRTPRCKRGFQAKSVAP